MRGDPIAKQVQRPVRLAQQDSTTGASRILLPLRGDRCSGDLRRGCTDSGEGCGEDRLPGEGCEEGRKRAGEPFRGDVRSGELDTGEVDEGGGGAKAGRGARARPAAKRTRAWTRKATPCRSTSTSSSRPSAAATAAASWPDGFCSRRQPSVPTTGDAADPRPPLPLPPPPQSPPRSNGGAAALSPQRERRSIAGLVSELCCG